MIDLTLKEIKEALNADFYSSCANNILQKISNIETDSRKITNLALFVALKGENVNGADFIPDAVKNGAVAVLVDKRMFIDVPQLVVPDLVLALGKLGTLILNKINPICVAITGSNGKTSVKEMLGSILSLKAKTLITDGNFNNELGVPLTLFRLKEDDKYAVIEMGANHLGEIDYLASLVNPLIAIINNVGCAHLEGFKSLEGVNKGKSEIFAHLAKDGVAIINGDDKFCVEQQAIVKKSILFGIINNVDVSATNLSINEQGFYSYLLNYKDNSILISLNVAGEHQVYNSLAAASASIALGLDLNDIKNGLDNLVPVEGRMSLKQFGRVILVDDTYNANPTSVNAAIKWLSARSGKKYLILGDLAELGADSDNLHMKVGEYAKECKIDALYCTGDKSKNTCKFFGKNFDTKIKLLEQLRSELQKELGDITVLVKGSHSSHMEEIVISLTEDLITGVVQC